ncbi:glycosyltransferase family 2 protein [Microbulbifer elongatus]|uniref:Glycosyltransferase family 2 protein n=1 Tax=Microbulbifer elongatus TaxID=86173 RepID=A0ABT1P144_9GAMM|nr:glycosyltransferase [Microbulbifer elongatus]MCQ3828844.1 glycosyltransferase family 2 protein [Microbulbifer elongatus]
MSNPVLDIAICTYRRPRQLEHLLSSLAQVELPEALDVQVSIVDNDPEGSAETLISCLTESFPMSLRYCRETRRGIPCARNRAIDEAHQHEAAYLVFIDDDEWVERDWLVNLVRCASEFGDKCVVSGRVRAQVPDGTSPVMAEFYERNCYSTGTRRQYCATNNVLIPIAVTRDLGLRFDESRPFAGGEDTLFFTEAVKRGVEIVFCAEAVVYEVIPAERVSIRWQSRRKYSAGTIQAVQKMSCGRGRLRTLLSGAFQLLAALAKIPLSRLGGRRDDAYRSWLKVCRSAGIVAGSLGTRSDFYRPDSGI